MMERIGWTDERWYCCDADRAFDIYLLIFPYNAIVMITYVYL